MIAQGHVLEGAKRMHLLLSLLLFAWWSAAERSEPICVPGSVNGDTNAEETYGEYLTVPVEPGSASMSSA